MQSVPASFQGMFCQTEVEWLFLTRQQLQQAPLQHAQLYAVWQHGSVM